MGSWKAKEWDRLELEETGFIFLYFFSKEQIKEKIQIGVTL